MNWAELDAHPGWQWCTAEGAALHSLLMGLESTLTEKLEWLESAEDLTIALRTSREELKTTESPTA